MRSGACLPSFASTLRVFVRRSVMFDNQSEEPYCGSANQSRSLHRIIWKNCDVFFGKFGAAPFQSRLTTYLLGRCKLIETLNRFLILSQFLEGWL